MTEHDDELKDLFQQKNMEDAFSPDEENWEKMAAYIKNKRNGKRRFFVYFSLLFILGISTSWLFIEQSKNEKSAVEIKPQVNEKKTNEPITPTEAPNSNQTRSSIHVPETHKQNQLKTETPAAEKNAVASFNSENSKGNRYFSTSKQAEPKHTSEKIASETIEKPKSPTTKITPSLSITNVSEKQKSNEKPIDSVVAKQKIEEKPISSTGTEPALNDKENNVTEAATKTTSLIKPTSSKLQINKPKEQNFTERAVIDDDFMAVQKSDTILTDALTMKKIILFTEKPNFKTAAVVPIRDSILPKKLLSHRIFLEAGLNYQLGWKTNNVTEAKGINPLIGLHYYHDVSRRAGVSVGLMYSSINHLSATSHTSTTTRLKFGEEIDATVVSAQNMHYLLMPLKLNYSLSRNDFVCIGYTIAYLLDVDSKVETYSTRLNYSSTPVVSKSRGYSKGFNPYDGQIAICYRRRIFKEFYLNGEFFYGLRDIKNNVVYKSDEFERAYGFKLTAGINLWKK